MRRAHGGVALNHAQWFPATFLADSLEIDPGHDAGARSMVPPIMNPEIRDARAPARRGMRLFNRAAALKPVAARIVIRLAAMRQKYSSLSRWSPGSLQPVQCGTRLTVQGDSPRFAVLALQNEEWTSLPIEVQPSQNVQLKLRFPEKLRGRIESAAARNERSMNAEIVHRLEQSFQKEDQATNQAALAQAAATTAVEKFWIASGGKMGPIEPSKK
jgi:hypothetical protein